METYLDFGFLCLAALMKWQQLVQQLFKPTSFFAYWMVQYVMKMGV
jgi:hypothetical protein